MDKTGVKMSINTDFSKILSGYSNKWIALSADNSKVVGVGSSPKEAVKKANKNKEYNPILTKVPENCETFIL